MSNLLQAFHDNPALGGFGNESGADALGQIVKELVDNAVDACRFSAAGKKRVRIELKEISDGRILQVTVIDNGVGMQSIQDSVNAFSTTKKKKNTRSTARTTTATAGRYGIGLTLCILHAQRLVPNSRAVIISATKDCTKLHRAEYVVQDDQVVCVQSNDLEKNFGSESGTNVTVHVPAGDMAAQAWPRLNAYFSRFQLSLRLPCSLQVMAPSLSKLPLYVKSPLEMFSSLEMMADGIMNDSDDDDEWKPNNNTIEDDDDLSESSDAQERQLEQMQRIVSSYLRQSVKIENIAHSSQPIGNKTASKQKKGHPRLSLDLIVYQKEGNDEEEEEEEEADDEKDNTESPAATLQVIRMVNRIPLLDGAEASACGLVQALGASKAWANFGLILAADTNDLYCPTYHVRDADNVSQFFMNNSVHQLHQLNEDNDDEQDEQAGYTDDGSTQDGNNNDDNDDTMLDEFDSDLDLQSLRKKPVKKKKIVLLPAHLRLGQLLLIVQIHAKPSQLPLPTLSKSRLPLNDAPITAALEAALLDALQSLQRTNSSLLLTRQQLKWTTRDARFIPSVSAALALVVCKSRDESFRQSFGKMISKWSLEKPNATATTVVVEDEEEDNHQVVIPDDVFQISKVGPMIEAKLRRVCTHDDDSKKKPQLKIKKEPENVVIIPTVLNRKSSESSWENSMVASPATTPVKTALAEDSNVDTSRDESIQDSLGSANMIADDSPVSVKTSSNDITLGRILGPDEDDYEDSEWW